MTRNEPDDLDTLEGEPVTPEDNGNSAEKERKRAERQRAIMEKIYFRISDEEMKRTTTGGLLLINMFEKWEEIPAEVRDEIVQQLLKTLAKTPRAPIELAGKLVADVCEAIQTENIPDHPIAKHRKNHPGMSRKSIPPVTGSDEFNEKVLLFAKKMESIKGKIRVICDQHNAAYQIWLMNRQTSEMVCGATTVHGSENSVSPFIPRESGIRTKDSAEKPAEEEERSLYDRVRRNSETMKRVLTRSAPPEDILKNGTSDEDPE